MIHVALIDDDLAVGESLATALPDYGDYTLSAHYTTAAEALAKLSQGEAVPDLLLVDIRMPGMNGVECVRKLKVMRPGLPVIMLTACGEGPVILQCFLAGANGYLVKPVLTSECVSAINRVLAGEESVTLEAAEKLVHCLRNSAAQRPSTASLTVRELQIINGLFRYLSDKEIASELRISTSTVHSHMHQLFRKLGVNSRSEAVRRFLADSENTQASISS